MRINMRDWNEDALLVVAQQTHDELMKQYIKSILAVKFEENTTIKDLYKKLREGQNIRNDIIWASIANKLINGTPLMELRFVKIVLKEMPMDYLAYVAVSSNNIAFRYFAREIGHEKQEIYEKEIGIYDMTYEKFSLDEKELKLERRMIK